MADFLTPMQLTYNLMTTRGYAKLAKHLNLELARYHARVTLPKHFTMGAYQLYDYQPRGSKYTRRKRRKYGHTNPNQFAGHLKNIVLATAPGMVTATQNRFRVRAKGTQRHKLWERNRQELNQVNDRELDDYGQRWRRGFLRLAGRGEYRMRKLPERF
jgi:hypothetical protein